MNKTALISQPAGLGDTIFAQGVADHLIKQGYEVIWPVKNHMLLGLQRAYPKVKWIPESLIHKDFLLMKEDCEVGGVRVVPIRWSDQILKQPVKYWMKTKFDLMGLDWRNWKEGAKFKRCGVRECKIFHEIYELERGEKYNLINTSFRNDSSKKVNINPNNGLKDVVMGFHEGYSLFDHADLIEQAENIYVANSSIFYLLELLELSAKEVHLYERTPDEVGFPHVDYLMTKNYILH
jgi:hypothetical protein